MAQSGNESHANRYYIINDESKGVDFEWYLANLNRFGGHIKALEFKHVSGLYAKRRAAEIFRQHINHIERLSFDNCCSELWENGMFSQPLDVTHLIFRRHHPTSCNFMPKCRNLQKLELCNTHHIWYDDLQQIIRENPKLRSLILYDFISVVPKSRFNDCLTLGIDEIIMMIARYSNRLRELAVVSESIQQSWNISESGAIFENVESFQHLESLAMILYSSMIGILQRLGMGCKQLKHLEFHEIYDGFESALLQVIPSFKQIESLHLLMNSYDDNAMSCAVKHLPKLRHLCLCIYTDSHRFADLVSLFYKCLSLETITHSYKPFNAFRKPATFVSVQLFEKFIEMIGVTGKSNARIEVMHRGRIIGFLTANGLVWRNKRMHWTGCDTKLRSSSINLLNLANQPINSQAEPQRNLLDAIFGYFDVYSLCSMAETNTRSSTLVDQYITKHSQQRKTFNITEFVSMDYANRQNPHFIQLHSDKFVKYVANLHIDCHARRDSRLCKNMQ